MRSATVPAIFAAGVLLAACSTHVQTTSGADYLARYDAPLAAASGEGRSLDELVREAAAVEPTLTFPARFGIARIENGRLGAIPPAEAALWQELAAGLGPRVGEFVPVDPLGAAFTAESLGYTGHDAGALAATIRLGAARQHLDAVLVYAVDTTARSDATVLAFADLTLIGGAFLPTREIEATGAAAALLIDVRNGYPYGRTDAAVELSELATSWGSDDRTEEMRREAEAETVAALAPKVREMFDLLIREMLLRSG